MAISSGDVLLRKSETLSSGTTFVWSGIFFDTSDIIITLDGVTLTEGVDYTVSGTTTNGVYYDGGTFTFSPAITGVVLGVLAVPQTQPNDWNPNEDLPPDEVEVAADRATVLAVQASDISNIAIKFPSTESSPSNELPSVALRSGKILTFDSSGDVQMASIPTTTLTGLIASATASGTDTYSITLLPAPSTLNQTDVLFVSFANTNTSTTPTLNNTGLGARTMILPSGDAIPVGALTSVGHLVQYNGTNYVVYGIASPVAFPVPEVTTATTATTITSADSGKWYSNEGATSRVDFTFSSQDTYHQNVFYCQDLDGIRLTMPSGQTLQVLGGEQSSITTIAGGYVEFFDAGSRLEIKRVSSTEWTGIFFGDKADTITIEDV